MVVGLAAMMADRDYTAASSSCTSRRERERCQRTLGGFVCQEQGLYEERGSRVLGLRQLP